AVTLVAAGAARAVGLGPGRPQAQGGSARRSPPGAAAGRQRLHEGGRREAEKLVRGLGASDRAIVVQMGSVPTPRSSMSGDQTELLQAIAQVTASDTRADLEAGLSFGRDSLRGLPHGELVVIGDGAYGDAATLAALSERVSLEGAEPRFVPIG